MAFIAVNIVHSIFFVLAFAICVYSASFPKHLKRCSARDPNVAQCLHDALQDAFPKLKNGVPSLGMYPLDPLFFPAAKFNEGSVQMAFTNSTVTGLSAGKITNTNYDIKNHRYFAEMVVPTTVMSGSYKLEGRFLLLPITGNGTYTITLYDATVGVDIKCIPFKKNGKDYQKVDKVKVSVKPKRVQQKYDNLFNGDKRLGDTMNRLLNENWQVMYEELGPRINEILEIMTEDYANKLFLNVPHEEIYPNKI